MNSIVKKYIEDNIQLIETNTTEAWKKIYNNFPIHDVPAGKFTEILLDADINPLNYLNYVPDYYLFDSDVEGKFIIPNHVKIIGRQAFDHSMNLTEVIIPDGVTTIRDYAFYECRKLTKIDIPSSVINIGIDVFWLCINLTSITIPGSIKYLGSALFQGCARLKTCAIEEGVLRIEDRMFYDCTALSSLTLPSSIIQIDAELFSNCTSLKEITYLGTKEQWESIGKSDYWSSHSSLKTVHCSDGDIKI